MTAVASESADDWQTPGFAVGDPVVLAASLPYLKTADPMPMLRPPDLVVADEVGRVVEIRPRGWFAVAFRRGTFLIAAANLRSAVTGSTPTA
ncbi:DUF3148 domain-containing protein [Cyanobium sp. FGCU-6]|nr:DUF3148 domain-containing protein [Cyanobium sp. FGCU6]